MSTKYIKQKLTRCHIW